ncbi:hypothetical protein L3X38_019938 [Prunus dulcis]|uniref:Uncharacterized protein n=1 Tax=Prunus dulcis TaxID=3755 RepID=A0AAD4WC39_PRUDU|nr:hypothetical protein L3X38_019938 [Prunus dulcis]
MKDLRPLKYLQNHHLTIYSLLLVFVYLKRSYFTFIGGILVTWRSKKQNVVARSLAEAEYRGIAQGVCELLWLRISLSEIDFPPKKVMELYCDNQSVREIANNLVRRNAEVNRHYIKERLVFHDSLDKLGI